MTTTGLSAQVKANGWRFRRDRDREVVEGAGTLPDESAQAVADHQSSLARIVGPKRAPAT
jgi:hypothetical protein